MDRRSFLKVLGAIGAGIALKPVPVVGQQFSELVPEKVYVVGEIGPELLGRSEVFTTAYWIPPTNDILYRNMRTIVAEVENARDIRFRPSSFVRVVGS